MAQVLVTMRIMPEGVETDLHKLENDVKAEIKRFGGDVAKVEVLPVAFGLKSVNITFISDEAHGGTEELEKKISAVHGVSGVEVTDVRRAIG